MMMYKGKIANEFGEVIGSYWFRPSMNCFTLRVWRINLNGFTEEGIRRWCLEHDCQWWEGE